LIKVQLLYSRYRLNRYVDTYGGLRGIDNSPSCYQTCYDTADDRRDLMQVFFGTSLDQPFN